MENDKINIIKKFINENKNRFNDQKKLDRLNKMLSDYSSGNKGKLDEDIKLMLVNNKDILKKEFENSIKNI